MYAMLPTEWYDENNSAGARNIQAVLDSMERFVRNSNMAMPGADGDVTLDFFEKATYSTSLVYSEFHKYVDRQVTKVVLGQTLSTDGGVIGSGSEALGRVQAETGLAPRIDDDCEMVAEPLTELARLITYHRFGSDELAPTVGFESGEVSINTLDFAINKLNLPVGKSTAYEMLGLKVPEEDEEVVEPREQASSLFGGGGNPFELSLADEAAETARQQEDYLERVKDDLKAAYLGLGDHYAGQVGNSGPPAEWSRAPEEKTAKLAGVLSSIMLVAYATGRARELERARVQLADDIDFSWSRQAHDEARDFLLSKQVMTRDEFDKLDAKLLSRCFTIAGEEDERVLTYARDKAAEVATGDLTTAEYREALTEQNPWLSDHHVETVIRTNVGQSYEAGRFTELTQGVGQDIYVMYEYAALDDGRTRPSHKAMDGRRFAADDPELAKYWGPNGYNCRCTMIPITAEEARRRGLRPTGGKPEMEFDEGFDQGPDLFSQP
jgi:SPP1 gp7 family putative phage head morphogenesis protein